MISQYETMFELHLSDHYGYDKLLDFLKSSDFFKAPCSTKFHLACEGGLAQHTMNVIKCACDMNSKYGSPYEKSSVIIAGLGHDFCKINFYSEDLEAPSDAQVTYLRSLLSKAGIKPPEKLNKSYASILINHLKDGKRLPLPDYKLAWAVNDMLPLGHGEKSLYIMSKFIDLTPDEALSIRWHMQGFDPSIHFPYPNGYAFQEAVKKSKLVSIIILADIEASNLVEVEDEKEERNIIS